MYRQPRKSLLALSVALALTVMSGTAAADTMNPEISDARMGSRIETTYALSAHLRANDIEVSVQDGKATLSGTVEEDIKKELAEQIALGVRGVTEVDNQIAVETDYVAPERSEERRFGEVVEDATITAAVKSKLMWSRYAEGLATSVDVNSGQVTLTGTAGSEEAKELAERLAMNTRGVQSVDNQLEIEVTADEPSAVVNVTESGEDIADSEETVVDSAKDVAEDAGDYISDSWITTKVKSSYMWSGDLTASDISVTTTDGDVVLSGRVRNEVDRDQAIELARALRGVRSVDAEGLNF